MPVNIFFANFFSGYQIANLTHIMNNIGKTIKILRKAAGGWSQADLGKRAGISKGQISHWEIGERNPGRRSIQKLAKAFGMPEEEFDRLIRSGGDEKLVNIWLRLHQLPKSECLKDAILALLDINEIFHEKGISTEHLDDIFRHIRSQADFAKKLSDSSASPPAKK